MKIEKSFQPEQKSTLNEALRPEIERLKEQMRKNQKKEKMMSALLAEGKITRSEKELKEPAKEQQPE